MRLLRRHPSPRPPGPSMPAAICRSFLVFDQQIFRGGSFKEITSHFTSEAEQKLLNEGLSLTACGRSCQYCCPFSSSGRRWGGGVGGYNRYKDKTSRIVALAASRDHLTSQVLDVLDFSFVSSVHQHESLELLDVRFVSTKMIPTASVDVRARKEANRL